MESNYIEDKKFEKINFIEKPLLIGTYENCVFNNCDFSNADLSNFSFSECEFSGCNISMAKLTKTSFNDIVFKDCKLLGLYFEDCHSTPFIVAFENCILNFSSFYKQKLKKTVFRNSTIQEVDFTDADLHSSVFDQCDLTKTKFENTILEKVDLRTAFNYSINPELNKIKKAKFSIPGIIGLLDKYDIEIEP